MSAYLQRTLQILGSGKGALPSFPIAAADLFTSRQGALLSDIDVVRQRPVSRIENDFIKVLSSVVNSEKHMHHEF